MVVLGGAPPQSFRTLLFLTACLWLSSVTSSPSFGCGKELEEGNGWTRHRSETHGSTFKNPIWCVQCGYLLIFLVDFIIIIRARHILGADAKHKCNQIHGT